MDGLRWILVAVLLIGLGWGDVRAEARTTERSFPATEPGKLTVAAKHGGEIRVMGWDKPEIHVIVTDRKGNIKVSFEPSGADLTIRGAYDGPARKKISTDATFEIQVPRRFDLDLRTDGGDLALEGVEGEVDGQTMGGNITIADLTGKVDLRTMGGNIRAAKCEIVGPLRTMGGNVSIAEARRGVDVETMGGNVEIGRVDGPVHAHTAGGSISILLGPGAGDCEASTNGGNVTLYVPSGYSAVFDVSSSGLPAGSGIDCRVPGLSLGNHGKLGTGDHHVSLQTSGGRIRVVPAE